MKTPKKKGEVKLKKWDIKPTKKEKDMGAVAAILSRKGTIRSAVDLNKLKELSGLTEEKVNAAIKKMQYHGMNIVSTDDNPPRFYWSK